jgi:hypothetical protein
MDENNTNLIFFQVISQFDKPEQLHVGAEAEDDQRFRKFAEASNSRIDRSARKRRHKALFIDRK